MNKLKKAVGSVALLVIALACENDDATQKQALDDSPVIGNLNLANVNGRTSSGATYALYTAEYLTTGEAGQIGRTVYFKDVGNKKLEADFVPGLSLDGTDNVSYYIDQKRPSNDLSIDVTSN